MTWKESPLPISLIQMLRAQQNYLCDQAADEIERLQAQLKADRIICHNEYAERFAEARDEIERLHKRLEELAPDETIVMKHTGIKT